MRFSDLPQKLNQPLDSLWFVTGLEPLLMIEAADAIRSHARAQGYTERTILNASGHWDWSQVITECQSMGLFADKKIVEVRLATMRPGPKGAEVLNKLAQMHYDRQLIDVIVIVSMPSDWTVQKLAWYKKLSANASTVQCDPVTVKELPMWFQQRFVQQNQHAEPAAIALLTERCEGNLLAAKQELLKLAYRYPKDTTITQAMIQEAVSDVSRFDSENLMEAMMSGQGDKAARILQSLKAEGESIPSFFWMVADEIRQALRTRVLVDEGTPIMNAVQTLGIYGSKRQRVKNAAQRLSQVKLENALMLCADIDRLAKGLFVKDKSSDAWAELTSLAIFLSRR